MPVPGTSWLMVIDHQPGFSHPDSPWYTPAMAVSTPNIERLVPLFGDRVLFTRFVPPSPVDGSWRHYYAKWAFATEADADRLWALEERWGERRTIASHTFSKWTAETRAILGPHPDVVLCGVSTDCCVLATALAAVDDGAQVTVVADACAAKTPAIHADALRLLSYRAPQLAILTTEDCRTALSAA